MSENPSEETLDRILVAAEPLFAKLGYHGTSLRQVTMEAKVNLAAVNYHHGDKENLYLEVLRRRIRPINQTRLTGLAIAEGKADGQPVPLPVIFQLLAEPLFGLFADLEGPGPHAGRLIGRSLSEPLPFMEKFQAEEFQPVLARFGQAIRRHHPSLPPEEFLWRLSFVVGAMQHAAASLHHMKFMTRGICRDNDHAAALSHFVQFATAAFPRNRPGGG
ncbi:MAG: TetR/AcrR family transcriptional regulator [Opitutae bacterium]|nr:TetR/AcrR family transcriptional regulator [Opitutae bacterium]